MIKMHYSICILNRFKLLYFKSKYCYGGTLMNQKQLEIFSNLADSLNFTRTAEQMFLSQTTVTLQIRNLEEELQVKLFERTSRSVKLTYAGSVFLGNTRNILKLMDEAKKQTQEAQSGYTGRLKIGFADDANATGISKFIRFFSENNPQIRMQVYGGYPEQLLQELNFGEYDLIFAPAFRKNMVEHYYHSLLLGRYRTVAAFHRDHPFSSKKRLTFKDFEGQDYIYTSGINEELVYSSEFYHRLLAEGVHVRVLDRIDNIDTVFLMLDANMGVTVLLEYFAKRFSESSDICICPIDEDLEKTDFLAIWRKGQATKELRQLTDSLKSFPFPGSI